MSTKNDTNRLKIIYTFTLLVLLIFTIYSNTFHASWHFDDKPNILDNTRLHITDLAPGSLWNTFFAKKEGGQNEFYRPLPSLSFALNWYVGQDDTFGYHFVNIAIHATTAFVLYLTTFSLFLTPKLKNRYSGADVHFIALLNAVLWAVNPIQVQAVTYIVQRMAAMATMFYILGIFFYIRGRQAESAKIRVLFYVLCGLTFVFAFMSKENALMMPASLFLVEIIFFRDFSLPKKNKYLLPLLVVGGVFLILLGLFAIRIDFPSYFAKGYTGRPFTLAERLLTEPRIILFYLSQLFYPVPARLSITHDIVISKSFFSPWTTLPAITVVLLMIGIGVSYVKKKPLVAFAILFFFLNHVIESSVIPLELIFEHRNYLPSLFIFLPIAAFLLYLFTYYKDRSRSMYVILATFVTLTIIGLGCFTYTRNRDWRTETTLWRDAMIKAPRDARPPWNVAIALAWDRNVQTLQLDVAQALFEKALSLNQARDLLDARILRNMGLIYYHRGSYDKAIQVYKKGLENDPNFLEIRYDLISSLIMKGEWDEAIEETDRVAAKSKNNLAPDYFKLKGFILLWKKQPEKALVYFQKAIKMEPDNRAVLLNTGIALSLLGKSRKSELFLEKAAKTSPEDIRPVYALIENSVRSGDIPKAEKYAAQMLAQFPIQTIIDGFDILTDNYRTAPMSPELIIPVVKRKMMRVLEDLQTPIPAPRLNGMSEK